MKRLGTTGYDPLAAQRAAELEEILDELARVPAPQPTLMFESLLLAYAALRSRRFERVTVMLGGTAYDRAEASGLLSWCREQYPDLTFAPPSKQRGPRPSLVILDEAVEVD